jgi:hypothetical protein
VSERRCFRAGAFSSISYSSASRINGTQPAPLSTDTISSSGNRSSMPEQMMLTTTRAARDGTGGLFERGPLLAPQLLEFAGSG